MSLNIFVVVPTESRYGIVFGKNSNRPSNEVQELVYEPAGKSEGDVKCTHVSVPSAGKTSAVILSKPAWMWGCEMGANEHGVSGGTVTFKESDPTSGLLAQDLLRLALEKSENAERAVDVIGHFLLNFVKDDLESTFVLVDRIEAWHMEGKGKAWVAKRVAPGFWAFPGSHCILDNFDKASPEFESLFCPAGSDGQRQVPWRDVPSSKLGQDELIEQEKTVKAKYFNGVVDFGVKEMTQVLRNTDHNISRPASDALPTAASQVSVLPKNGSCCHWFTATPDPTLSVFKPFIFTPNVRISPLTKSLSDHDRQHQLYRLHASATSCGENKVISLLQEMEANCLNEVDTFMFEGIPGQTLSEVDDLFKDCVETEAKFYK